MFLRLFLFTVLAFGLFLPVSAQEETVETTPDSNKITETIKIDEFGRMEECGFGARIDAFFIALMNNPSARGYVIFYRGTEDMAANQAESFVQKNFTLIRNYTTFRNFDAERIVVIDGGFRESAIFINELWLVPEGGIVPQPTDTVKKPKLPKNKAYLVDRAYLELKDAYVEKDEEASEEIETETTEENTEIQDETSETETTEAPVQETPEELTEEELLTEETDKFDWISDYFINTLRENKTARGVLIFYADEENYDLAKARYLIENNLREYSQKEEIDLSRVKIIFGGYYDYPTMELWIVPKKAKEPIPTPKVKEIVQ